MSTGPVAPRNRRPGSSGGATQFGLSILGFQHVVSWALPAKSVYLVSDQLFEVYEAHRISMRADEPTRLGVALGVGGAVAAGEVGGGGGGPRRCRSLRAGWRTTRGAGSPSTAATTARG